MKVKLIKKSVSLLLVLCMLLSLVPMGVFAAAPDTSNDDFYKIVHLDAGRKFWSVANIKALLDEMGELGYNQLQIYFSDNQGFRLALNDMNISFTSNGNSYNLNLADALGNGIYQNTSSAKCDANSAHFRPSLEPDGAEQKNYLTQSDMDIIIDYANNLGIEIVPALNFPGHAGALLDTFPQFKYGNSNTSVDLDPAKDGRAFALAVLEKYITYFSGKGCKFFCIGADEYGYDTGETVDSISINGNLYSNFATFMDEAATLINSYNMTPRAFNDYFYTGNLNPGVTLSDAYKSFQVYVWSGSNLNAIWENGHDVINTSETCYYALGSQWYSLDSTASGVNSFDINTISVKSGSGGTVSDPAGAMFCIWNDRGYHASEPAGGDGGATVLKEVLPYMTTFASKLPQEVTVELEVGEEYAQVFGPYEGELTAADIATMLGLHGHVTASSITVTPGTPGTPGTDGGDVDTSSALTALTVGTKVVLGDGTNFLVNNNGTLGVGTVANATQWDVVAQGESFNFVSAGKYLYVDTSAVNAAAIATLSDSAPSVPFNIVNGVVKQAWWPSNAVKIGDVQSTVAYAVSSGTPGTPGTPATTTFKLTGATAGTETFTYNGAQYTITVEGEHVCNYNIPATCQKKATCSCGAEDPNGALDPNTHVGELSTANCTTPATYSVCKHTVGSTNSAIHTGGTYKLNEKAASETEEGYTGDIHCSGCTAKLEDGQVIPKVHTHSGGVATCTTPASCASCGQPYGNVDLNNHVGDRKITGITATFTGNIICVSCGNQVEAGTAIANDPNAVYITVNANSTATHTADGQLGTNGATGNTEGGLASYTVTITETTVAGSGASITAWESGKNYAQGDLVEYQGSIFYRKYGGSDGTPDASAQRGAWGLVKEWTAAGYEANSVVTYNGEYYKNSGYANESAVPGIAAVWVKLDIGSGEGSGETVTKTIITFTAGATNGNDEVTIGGQKFIITVTGGNDPIIDVPECDHEWEQKYDTEGHWDYCEKCGTSTTKTAHSGGNATCKELAVCSTCHQAYGVLAEHNYSDATCETLATCSVCGDTTGDYAPHTGGSANCQEGAHCSVCNTVYTDVNPNNHVELVEVEGTYVAPTDTADGKEADKECTACGETVTGATIPALNANVVEITVAVGGTHQFVISGKDATSLITQGDTNIASASGNFDPGQADKPEVAPQPVTTLTSGGIYVFSNGNGKYIANDNPPAATENGLEARQFTITQIENGNTYYIQDSAGNYLMIPQYETVAYVRTKSDDIAHLLPWTYDSATQSFSVVRDGKTLVLSYSADSGKWTAIENGTPVKLCTPGTPFEAGHPSSTTITITGVTEGVTYITVDGTRYKINVVDAALLNAVLATPTWMTNRKVSGFLNADETVSDFAEQITAAAHVDIVSANGVALADVIPPEATTVNGSVTASHAIFWRGMRHGTGQVQGHNGADFHQQGDIILYVRYDRDAQKWYGSYDRTSWLDLTGYTLDIYYLQETAVTKEVITEVVDWGPDYDSFTSDQWASETYVLLDFAVSYDGVGRHPALNAYPNNGDGSTTLNQKTIAFHCYNDTSDAKIYKDSTSNRYYRRIDTIFAEETMQYEVYMITVTRTSDTPTTTLGAEYSPDLKNTTYTYAGEEKIIWTIDEATYEEKVGQTTTDGKVLGALDTRPDGFDIANDEHKATMYRTVGGRPVVDYVQIYQNQGLLVTYYVRARKTEDALTVHYRLEGSTEDFHKYYIAVEQGHFFHPGFNDDPSNEVTGLMNNTVINFYGNTHTVTSNLSKLFDVPAQYRTGMYGFTQHIDFILADGTTIVNQEEYTESMGNIKEVILYYGVDNTHFVPIDFGHHLTIDKDFFKHHVDENFIINKITVLPSPMTGYFHKYGNLTPYGNDSYGYMPYYILDGHEDAYGFTLEMTDTVTGDPATETHYVVFFPATTVYYEEFFLIRENALGGSWQAVQDGADVSLANFNYETDHQQDVCYADTKDIYNYGRDDGINRENGPSNGTELVAKDSTAYAEFVINGTGIEIYANSTKATSNAAVLIYSGTGSSKTLYKMFVVDTRLKEDENATSATDRIEEIGTAYNVPIVSVLDMPYDTYTVRIGYVTSSAARTDGFRFDGFRVLEPLQNDYALPSADGYTAGYVYEEHHEKGPTFYDMRDAVLAQANIPSNYDGDYADQIAPGIIHQVNSASDSVKAVIISNSAAINSSISDEIIVDLLDNSAKNEIYLWPGESIVFKVNDAYNMQVGMKALNGTVDAQYYVAGVNGVPTIPPKCINTSTDMYYPVTYGTGVVSSELTGDTVVITNNSESGVLAITKLKCLPLQFSNTAIDPLMPLSEIDYTRALVAMGYNETPVVDVPEETEPEETIPEETEPEVTEPEDTIPEETEPEVTTPDVEFVGASLSLKGDIGLNFYVKLSDAILADEDAYMQFIVGGNTKKVPLTDGILDESDGSYRFSVALNAKNMGDAVVAQVFNEDGAVGDSKTLSIKDYADYVIKNSNKGQLVKLMKAMLNYGAAAQIEFNYNIDNLVNADLDDADKTKPGKADVDAFEHTLSGEEEGITVTSASLLLQSETKIRIYFKLAEGKTIDDYTFSVDGETFVPVKVEGGEYYIEKANVAAKDLDSVYAFQMGGLTLTYSGMSYINQVQKQGSEDVDLQKLAKTLYEYCQAANVYFG